MERQEPASTSEQGSDRAQTPKYLDDTALDILTASRSTPHAAASDRSRLPRWVTTGAAFCAGALATWMIGLVGNAALEKVTTVPLVVDTSTGVIGVDTENSYSAVIPITQDKDGVRVPAISEDSLKSSDKFSAWAEDGGGAATDLNVSFSVSSGLDRPIIITGVDVIVIDARPPVTGLYLRPAGGGANFTRQLSAPVARPGELPAVPEPDLNGDAWAFPLQVGVDSDAELFTIAVHPHNCLCQFEVRINYLSDGEETSMTIDDGGQPFQTTSSDAAIAAGQVTLDGDLRTINSPALGQRGAEPPAALCSFTSPEGERSLAVLHHSLPCSEAIAAWGEFRDWDGPTMGNSGSAELASGWACAYSSGVVLESTDQIGACSRSGPELRFDVSRAFPS